MPTIAEGAEAEVTLMKKEVEKGSLLLHLHGINCALTL